MIIELHAIQTFGPSNLNRDDTGNPKESLFGGVRRARISSQCAKRAIRTSQVFADTIGTPTGTRTKALIAELVNRLVDAGIDSDTAWNHSEYFVEETMSSLSGEMKPQQIPQLFKKHGLSSEEAENLAKQIIEQILKAKKSKKDEKVRKSTKLKQITALLMDQGVADEETNQDLAEHIINMKTTVLLYYSDDELQQMAQWIAEAIETGSYPKQLDKEFAKQLDGRTSAPDIALFGRMLAGHPKLNVDAACQFAHALSTHAVHTAEFDYFTAVDDLTSDEQTGAGMLGLVAYNSATYYRCVRIDWEQLVHNLNGDVDLAARTVDGFMKAFALVVPSGMTNSFVNQHAPDFLMAVVRPTNDGQSLLNAFELPVPTTRQGGYAAESVQALGAYWGRVETAFRLGDPYVAVMNPHGFDLASDELAASQLPDLRSWVDATVSAVSEE